MAYNIKMLKGNQASLPATPRDANSVYFTVDGGNIYLGDKLLTGKVSFTKPATGVEGTIYVDSNGIPFVWYTATSAYKQMLPQMPAVHSFARLSSGRQVQPCLGLKKDQMTCI